MRRMLLGVMLLLLSCGAAKSQNNLVVMCSEDYYQGDAIYSLKVDGATVSSNTPCKAQGGLTATVQQTNTFTGNWPNTVAHSIVITFTNDLWGGGAGKDRNLYLWSVVLNGAVATGTTVVASAATNWNGLFGTIWGLATPGSLTWNTTAVPTKPPTLAAPILNSATLGPVGITLTCNSVGSYAIGPLTLTCASVGTAHSVTLSWSLVTTCIQTNANGTTTTIPCAPTGYNIRRSLTTGGPYSAPIASVPGGSYTDLTVASGTTYYYIVTAYLSPCNVGQTTPCGESSYSNQVTAVVPTP